VITVALCGNKIFDVHARSENDRIIITAIKSNKTLCNISKNLYNMLVDKSYIKLSANYDYYNLIADMVGIR